MLNPTVITSLDDPRIRHFVAAREPEARRAGLILVESGRVVRRLLGAPLPLHSVLAHPGFWGDLPEAAARKLAGAALYEADARLLEGIVGHRLHESVMAAAQRPANAALSDFGPRVLALNAVNNAENVGALVRCAVAFGITDLLVDEASCSPWARRASRVSMGAVFRCRVRTTADLAADLRALAAQGHEVHGTSLAPGAVPLPQARSAGPWTLVMGAENDGLAPAVAAACTRLVTIPMPGGIDSLNVLAAGAICLHHLTQGAAEE